MLILNIGWVDFRFKIDNFSDTGFSTQVIVWLIFLLKKYIPINEKNVIQFNNSFFSKKSCQAYLEQES